VATVEMAILLPLLALLFLITVDFCRIFYFTITVENCARNGALWACDAFAQSESPYATVTEASRADFPQNRRGELQVSDPAPVVSQDGVSYAQVTCTFRFDTVTSFPGIAGPWMITRSVRARVVPSN
jgi:Flp pilus assembly protein TadG